ncbi:hypothetical protein JTE90_012521 [Oedothorax gibbosus]|uniref:Uncharacterized protein n=1 Tax=Oedothorax gibbosus TaxID=931172 RepID=A0AAV6UYY7_9ARAC|nr:hypothetical protein JTE90_012521 [Oedothorax gibbosus]
MKGLILLTLATMAYASLIEVPIVETIIVKHIGADDHVPSNIVIAPKTYHHNVLPVHPVLSPFHALPVKKYTVQYPKGLYHGPHGVGIYNPKLHDALEQAYYRG